MNIFSYMVDYCDINNNNTPARDLLLTIGRHAAQNKYMEGYPGWKESQRIKKLGIPLYPGMQPGFTWCVFVAWEILKDCLYDTSSIMDKTGKIGNTSGNEMAQAAIDSAANKFIKEIKELEAFNLAGAGVPVLAAARGIIKRSSKRGTGHVGIVAPGHAYKPGAIMIGQGGAHNGFLAADKAFPKKYVEKPRYFLLNKEG